jgi:methanethiol S-methyltransferase
MVRKVLVVGYGTIAYLIFLAVLVYTIGFLANVGVPKGIDAGDVGPVWLAVAVDAGLLALFAVQHTVMARPWFKRWWTRFVPTPIERSTFVLTASLALALLLWQWRPISSTVWSVEAEPARLLLHAVYVLGWSGVIGCSFLINHFDLFGLRQVMLHASERPYAPVGFRQPLVYRLVRHPLMIGFLLAFWATPDMTAGRLLFATLGTAYILVGVRFEERDLRRHLGEAYVHYEEQVPRFVPRLGRRKIIREDA